MRGRTFHLDPISFLGKKMCRENNDRALEIFS